jgi:hypothetical protein
MISVPVRIVDPSKDLNSYGVGSVDWKERVESWRVKQEKNIIQVTHKYAAEGKGDIEGTGSNGEDLQMYDPYYFTYICSAFFSVNKYVLFCIGRNHSLRLASCTLIYNLSCASNYSKQEGFWPQHHKSS